MSKKFFAFENEGADDVVVASAEDQIESQAELDAVADDVVAETGDVSELHSNIETGVEATDTLTDVAETVADAVESGEGLNETSARLAEVTIESIRVRLGMPASIGRMPSLESFKSGPASRVEASKVTLESSIVETIKQIWGRVVSFAKQIWEKIKVMVASITKNYDQLIKHLEGLKARAGSATGTPAEKDLKNKTLASTFAVGGKANLATAGDVLSNVSALIEDARGATARTVEVANKLTSAVASSDANAGSAAIDELQALGGKLFSKVPKIEDKTEGDKHVVSYGPVGGGDAVVVTTTKSKEGKVSVAVTFEKVGKGPETIEAIAQGQLSGFIDSLISKARGGKAVGDVARQSEVVVKKVVGAAEDVIRKAAKFADGEGAKETRKSLSELAGVASSLSSIVSNVSARIPAKHFSVLKAGADYASASISNIKAEKKDPAKA